MKKRVMAWKPRVMAWKPRMKVTRAMDILLVPTGLRCVSLLMVDNEEVVETVRVRGGGECTQGKRVEAYEDEEDEEDLEVV